MRFIVQRASYMLSDRKNIKPCNGVEYNEIIKEWTIDFDKAQELIEWIDSIKEDVLVYFKREEDIYNYLVLD